jgi:outer membrane protein
MAAMPATAEAQKKLEEAQAKYQAQAKSLDEDLQKQYTELQNLKEDELPAIRERKVRAFQDSQARAQEFMQQIDAELSKMHQELMLPITTELKGAIESVGREGGYTIVQSLDPSIVFYYGAPAENITPLVKAKLGIK